MPRVVKTIFSLLEVESWLPGAAGAEERVFNGDGVLVWKDEKVQEMDGGDGHTTM